MTYAELLAGLLLLSEKQLANTVTVEDGYGEECHIAELRICDKDHNCLEDGHPVIYF
jgi:hypothetical protein